MKLLVKWLNYDRSLVCTKNYALPAVLYSKRKNNPLYHLYCEDDKCLYAKKIFSDGSFGRSERWGLLDNTFWEEDFYIRSCVDVETLKIEDFL